MIEVSKCPCIVSYFRIFAKSICISLMVIKDDVSEVHSDAFCKLMKAGVGKDSGTVSGSVGNKTA